MKLKRAKQSVLVFWATLYAHRSCLKALKIKTQYYTICLRHSVLCDSTLLAVSGNSIVKEVFYELSDTLYRDASWLCANIT